MLQQLQIGPPHSSITEGMNTTFRRQQLPPNMHHQLRNVRISREAFQRIKGKVRLFSGSRVAKSLSHDGDKDTTLEIPYSDASENITDYNFGTRFTVFVAYRVDVLASDVLLMQHSNDATPPWSLKHLSTGKIQGTIYDGTTQATLTTTATFGTGSEIVVWMTRNGANSALYVNDQAAITDATLSATADVPVNTESIWMGSDGNFTGQATFYEARLFRTVESAKTWRVTKYPDTGKFGDPNMVLHLIFEDGSGTTVTDYSRISNSSIALTGGWTWNSSSLRQVSTPVTGLQLLELTRGRKWIVADIGNNHYRIPVN